eukprot:TRINITY_DN64022_c0_g1_i1.p1 TRINITY_DN64022_c0_g1~~TRINITY_DN64022_c0_g1_i1.p1  ORF type:complete len:376 (-),score=70.07 TRINITY_DN64022_c0_g1_i1:185-1312(-)
MIGSMPRFVFLLIAALRTVAGWSDVQKKVVNTAWWPAGTEKKAESVGILSHGFVFMTGMMEMNATLQKTLIAEVSDVRDIARAGGADLTGLVDCLLNAPAGNATLVRKAFLAALPTGVRPALTVVEVDGEYGSYFPVSASCIAAIPEAPGSYARRQLRVPGAYGVAANGLLHMEAVGRPDESIAAMDDLGRLAALDQQHQLLDCTVFVRDKNDGAFVRRSFLVHFGQEHMPSLTVIIAGPAHPGMAQYRCVAAIPDKSPQGAERNTVQSKFAFLPGQCAQQTNATDGFEAMGHRLAPLGLKLTDVVNCVFYLQNSSNVFDLFAGFADVFNVRHPPPPSRDELEASSDIGGCAVTAKCIAALPVSQVTAEPIPVLV